MKVPVVLTTVRFDIDTEGRLEVSIDGQPHAEDRKLSRDDLRSVLDEITASLGTAVRVEVHEADGTTYSDIETPAENAGPDAMEPEPEQQHRHLPTPASGPANRSLSPTSWHARKPMPTATPPSTSHRRC